MSPATKLASSGKKAFVFSFGGQADCVLSNKAMPVAKQNILHRFVSGSTSEVRSAILIEVDGNDIVLRCRRPLRLNAIERLDGDGYYYEIVYEPLFLHVISASFDDAVLDAIDCITQNWLLFTKDPNQHFGKMLSESKRAYLEHFEPIK